jgi:hypothetical protein
MVEPKAPATATSIEPAPAGDEVATFVSMYQKAPDIYPRST